MSVTLSEHLPLLSSAPNGIQMLRELILELAVRGKLVPQDPKDEPASELLNRIAQERARLAAEGTCKKPKPIPPVGEDARPFLIPNSWRWARLGELALGINSGGTPSKNNLSFWNGDIPWASVKDLGFGVPLTSTQDRITSAGLEAGSFLAKAGSILVCTRMGLGKIGEARIDVAINQDLKALWLSNEIDKQYFINFFRTLSIKGSGMTVAGIKQDELLLFPVPIPSIAEQHRIVAKVDELMALCDQLEAEQVDAEATHVKLVATLLGTLAESADAVDLAANWQRLAEHFAHLFNTESSLDALKQTILQLAVMGKLVSQDPNDEPSGELLKRIAQERSRLGAERMIKKLKPMLPVEDHEHQHPIPAIWEYVRLQDICSTITDGTHQTPNYTDNGRPFLSAQNVKPFRFMPEIFRYVSEEDYQGYIKSTKPELGDVLLTRVGAMIGEAAVIDKEIDFAIYVSLALLKPIRPLVSAEYIVVWLNSPFGTHASIRDTLGRGVSAGNLNLGMIRAFALPLPPISEQHRIVAKVNELMSLCDHLKAEVAESRRRQERLASTLIESALKAA